jgi:hypothetical protein
MDFRHVRRWRPSLVQYLSYHIGMTLRFSACIRSILPVKLFLYSLLFLRLDCLLLHITNFTSIALLWCLENGIWKNKIFYWKRKEHCFDSFGNTDCIELHYYGTITRCAYRIWLLVNFLSSPWLFEGGSAFT